LSRTKPDVDDQDLANFPLLVSIGGCDRHHSRILRRLHWIETNDPPSLVVHNGGVLLTGKFNAHRRPGGTMPPNLDQLVPLQNHVVGKDRRKAQFGAGAWKKSQEKAERSYFHQKRLFPQFKRRGWVIAKFIALAVNVPRANCPTPPATLVVLEASATGFPAVAVNPRVAATLDLFVRISNW